MRELDHQIVGQNFEASGFVMLPHVFSGDECRNLTASLAAKSGTCHRRLLSQPMVAEAASSEAVLALLRPLLGSEPKPVRAIYFDKTSSSNWFVPWHQDVTIALRQRVEVPGYGPWTIKEGMQHAHAPAELLENMITIRIHLDTADDRNGALRVLPASHRHGKLTSEQIATLTKDNEGHLCRAETGDILIMRPLLLHASHKSTSAAQRRILHLEFAGVPLPPPLEWSEEA